MNILSKEQVLKLHASLIKATGGSDGIRDEGMLDLALNNPFQSFGGKELYPSIQAKAARLCFGLVKNHAMLDGNKRLGTHVMLVFLALNGYELSYYLRSAFPAAVGFYNIFHFDHSFSLLYIFQNTRKYLCDHRTDLSACKTAHSGGTKRCDLFIINYTPTIPIYVSSNFPVKLCAEVHRSIRRSYCNTLIVRSQTSKAYC